MPHPAMRSESRPEGRFKVVIAGGGYAGLSCALRLARRSRDRAEITLISPSDLFFERIRSHQRLTGQNVGVWSLSSLLRGTGVRLRVGELQSLDLANQSVSLADGLLRWDELVLALGSRTDRDAIEGAHEHAVTLEPEAAADARRALERAVRNGGQVVVVGGGLTGIEAAAEMAEQFPGLPVTLVSEEPLAHAWSDAAQAHVNGAMRRLAVVVRDNVRVHAVRERRLLTDRGEIPFDVCLWTGGFVAHPLARAAGLSVNERGQVIVDASLRSTSHSAVHVAGDLAAVVDGEGVGMPMGCKTALPTGVWVAENIARRLQGREELPFQFRAPFFCVSLGRKDGLIQMAGPDGDFTGNVLTGRRGAWFKELICRSTMWALRLERLGIPGVQWIQKSRRGQAQLLAE